MLVAREFGLPDWNRIRRAWGSWGTAQRVLVGGRALAPPQRGADGRRGETHPSRALHAIDTVPARDGQTPPRVMRRRDYFMPALEGIRVWLEDEEQLSLGETERDYEMFVSDHKHLEPATPLLPSSGVRRAYPGLKWPELVAAARGELDPDDLVRTRGAERAQNAMTGDGFISTSDMLAILGGEAQAVLHHAKRRGSPTRAARLGQSVIWDIDDVLAHKAGTPSGREPYWRQGEILGSSDLAALLACSHASIDAHVRSRNANVPQPNGWVADQRYWLTKDVDAWLRMAATGPEIPASHLHGVRGGRQKRRGS